MTILVDRTLPGTTQFTDLSRVPHHPARRWPSRRRPGGRPFDYASLPITVRLSQASHRPTLHQLRWRRRVAASVLAGLTLLLLVGLVQLRSAGTATVPRTTGVVQVHAGESLFQLASRVAPDAPAAAVVERIVALNGLLGAVVRAGETLVVPVG